MKQFAVIGLGRFGSSVARVLSQLGHEVLGVDKAPEKVQAMAGELTHVAEGDATDEGVLGSLGVKNFDCAVVSVGEDIQASVLVTLLLKEAGVNYVVAKAINDTHGKLLKKVGADKVVYPERDMGVRVAHHLLSDKVLEHVELEPDYSIAEVECSDKLAGRTLGQLRMRDRYGINVLAIKRGKDVLVSPKADDRLSPADVMVVIGQKRNVLKFEEDLGVDI